MNYSIEQNKEWAIKLVMLKIKELCSLVLAINRGDFTNKEIKKIIKKYET